MTGSLEGVSAIVTGGAKGVGRGIVDVFLQRGADVIILDNDAATLGYVLQQRKASPVQGYVCDVTNADKLAELYDARLRGIANVLINNAGGGIDCTVLEPDSGNAWKRTLDVNLTAPWYMTTLFAQDLLSRKSPGSITFISSVHTAQGFNKEAAYDAAKHGLIGLMRSTALDLAPHGIRVNAVSPGGIYPAGKNASMPEADVMIYGDRVPMRRFGTPEEIGKVCAFLASDDASYMTGAEIRVDGGMSVKNSLF